MPCRTDDWPTDNSASKELPLLRAALCAVLTKFEALYGPDVVSGLKLNYEEAGFSRFELEKWWNDHKAADKQRRAREAEDRRLASLRASALAKLSDDERIALERDPSSLKKR